MSLLNELNDIANKERNRNVEKEIADNNTKELINCMKWVAQKAEYHMEGYLGVDYDGNFDIRTSLNERTTTLFYDKEEMKALYSERVENREAVTKGEKEYFSQITGAYETSIDLPALLEYMKEAFSNEGIEYKIEAKRKWLHSKYYVCNEKPIPAYGIKVAFAFFPTQKQNDEYWVNLQKREEEEIAKEEEERINKEKDLKKTKIFYISIGIAIAIIIYLIENL